MASSSSSCSSLLWLILLIIATTACCFHHDRSSSSAEAADSVVRVVKRDSGSTSQFSTQQNASSFWRTADFTLGFQRVADGDADEYLLCIWRSADLNQTALWWPSAEDFNQTAVQLRRSTQSPPTVGNGTMFSFASDGSLQLISRSDDGSGGGHQLVLWSVGNNASRAELRNTGNLLLLDESNNTVWQSFADRRDTMILPPEPGTAADVDLVADKPRLLQSRMLSTSTNQSLYAAGRFHVETDDFQNLYLHAMEETYGVDYIYSYGAINVSGYFTVSKGTTRIYRSNASMGISLVRLDPDSNVRVYVWSELGRVWTPVWQLLKRRCFYGSPCGSFGICNEIDDGTSVNCSCPPGYTFLDPLDTSKGCRSEFGLNFTAISCNTSAAASSNSTAAGATYTMTTVPNADYNYGDIHTVYNVSGAVDCGQHCLQLCLCAAASYADGGNCYLKGNNSGGIVMNGYNKTGNTLLVKELLLQQGDNNNSSHRSRSRAAIVIIGGVVGVLLIVGMTALLLLLLLKRRRYRSADAHVVLLEMDGDKGPVLRFTHQQLMEATDGFKHVLGEGGFGKVYKGWMKQKVPVISMSSTTTTDNSSSKEAAGRRRRRRRLSTTGVDVMVKAVAVKVLKVVDVKSKEEEAEGGDDDDRERGKKKEYRATRQFRAEVGTLGKIHHVNLVNLIGYCDEHVDGRQMRALVFEFMEKGSLDCYLSGRTMKKNKKNDEDLEEEDEDEKDEEMASLGLGLGWERRYSIALGMARGIAYLHHECRPPILHSDIKPQNVLLDAQFTAKVADFGFASRFQDAKSHLTLTEMRGTRGYMAPEWLKTDRITSKVDVYSFGVVLLELVRGICGCRYKKLLNDHDDSQEENMDGLPVIDWAYRYLESLSSETRAESDDLPPPAASVHDDDDDDDHHHHQQQEDAAGGWNEVESMERAAAAAGDRPQTGLPPEDDQQLQQQQQEQMIRLLKIGLWCVQHAPQMRPSMQQVLRLMEMTTTASSDDIDAPPLMMRTSAAAAAPAPQATSDDNGSISFFDSPSDSPSNFVELPYSALSAR